MTAPTRAELVSYVAGFLAALGTETGIALVDTAPGIATQLTQAQEAAAGYENPTPHYSAAEFFVLRRMRAAVAARVDFDATAVRAGRSQIFNQIDQLMQEAAAMAATYGLNLTSATPGSAGSDGHGAAAFGYTTDWIEPYGATGMSA